MLAKCRDGHSELQGRRKRPYKDVPVKSRLETVNYCFVVTAITPPIFPDPYFVVASHERYSLIREICDAGMVLSELIGPYA